MKDPVDTKLKAEIDAIVKKVKHVLKNIEIHDPIKDQTTNENQNLTNWSLQIILAIDIYIYFVVNIRY